MIGLVKVTSQEKIEKPNSETEAGQPRMYEDDYDGAELTAVDDGNWSDNIERQSSSISSRYRPSERLASILKSRNVLSSASSPKGVSSSASSPSQTNSSPTRNSDYKVSEDEDVHNVYNSPRQSHSYNRRNDSPVYRSPSREYYGSPRSGYDSPSLEHDTANSDGLSPFAKLSESLKMLQRHQPPLSDATQPQAVMELNPPVVVEPSADLRPVIERLANYVAKNGNEFEEGIREKKDPRFDFLNNWNMYHGFYLEVKKQAFVDMEREKQEGNIVYLSEYCVLFVFNSYLILNLGYTGYFMKVFVSSFICIG